MKPIQDFLANYSKENTVRAYRNAIKSYLEFIYGISIWCKQTREGRNGLEIYEEFAKEYLEEKRDYDKDLIRFASWLSEQEIPPKTAQVWVSGVKEWLVWHGIDLSQRVLKEVQRKMPKGGARTVSDILDKEKLRKILQNCDIRGRSVILTLASTGLRISELLSLEMDDLRLDTDPAEIIVRGEKSKTGEHRIVFLTAEAKQALLDWLQVRDKFLQESIEKTENFRKVGKTFINPQDQRVFSFTRVCVGKI